MKECMDKRVNDRTEEQKTKQKNARNERYERTKQQKNERNGRYERNEINPIKPKQDPARPMMRPLANFSFLGSGPVGDDDL